MPETDLQQPGLSPVRVAGKAGRPLQAAPGLAGADGYRHADHDPLVPLARDARTGASAATAGVDRAIRDRWQDAAIGAHRHLPITSESGSSARLDRFGVAVQEQPLALRMTYLTGWPAACGAGITPLGGQFGPRPAGWATSRPAVAARS